MRRSKMFAVAAVAGLAVAAACREEPARAPSQPAPPTKRSASGTKRVDRRPVALEGQTKGSGDALVNIVEFADFQCPFCRIAEPTIARVLKEYGGKVRLFFRHLPLASMH